MTRYITNGQADNARCMRRDWQAARDNLDLRQMGDIEREARRIAGIYGERSRYFNRAQFLNLAILA